MGKQIVSCLLLLLLGQQGVEAHQEELFYDPLDGAYIEDYTECDPSCYEYYDELVEAEPYMQDDGFYQDPYEADCDGCWYYQDEALYPTRKDDTFMDEISKPW